MGSGGNWRKYVTGACYWGLRLSLYSPVSAFWLAGSEYQCSPTPGSSYCDVWPRSMEPRSCMVNVLNHETQSTASLP